MKVGFRIPISSGIPDSLSCIPDSRCQDSWFHSNTSLDFRLHKQKFARFWNPDSVTWSKIKGCPVLQIFSKQQMSSFELYYCCSWYAFSRKFPFFLLPNDWNVPPFCTHYHKNSVFSVNSLIFWKICCRIDVIFSHSHFRPNLINKLLVIWQLFHERAFDMSWLWPSHIQQARME